MPEELTKEYNINNWNEAKKAFQLTACPSESFGAFPSTVYVRDASQSDSLWSIRKKSQEKFKEAWNKLAKM